MTLNQNQFDQNPIQGMTDLGMNVNTVAVVVDTSQATALVPGQAVKMLGTDLDGLPKVVAAAADSDDIWGFVNYSQKNATFPALSVCEISLKLNVMFMTASAAIARGAKLNVVIASLKVQSDAGGGKTVIGRAFDGAAVDGDLIRVLIGTPV